MELPFLAEVSTPDFVTPISRLWFNFIIPSKGFQLVTPVGSLTFLVFGLLWPPSFLCGPVSNCDTDPLVQLIEVLKIGSLFSRSQNLEV